MKKRKEWMGCGTALVTPFCSDGSIDEDALKRLVRFQIDAGIDFLVPCGTTGENPTLHFDEHLRVVECVISMANKNVPVLAGAGGNDTRKVVEMAKKIEALGADGILSVTPYYNKPTQEGLFQHFKAIAEATALPMILYNVPGRTGVNLLPDTVVRLSDIGNIIGIKEASGDIGQVGELAVKVPKPFAIFSGDDANTIPIVAFGGAGVISVISNQVPAMMRELTHFALRGKFDKALEVHAKLLALMKLNFVETNPIPVKAGLAMMGLIGEYYRLPMVPMSQANREKLHTALKHLNLVS